MSLGSTYGFTSVFTLFSKTVIWVWELSSHEVFLKLLRVLKLSMNNQTSMNMPMPPQGSLKNLLVCAPSLKISCVLSKCQTQVESSTQLLLSQHTMLWWIVYISSHVWTHSISCFLVWPWIVRLASQEDSEFSYQGYLLPGEGGNNYTSPDVCRWWTTYSSFMLSLSHCHLVPWVCVRKLIDLHSAAWRGLSGMDHWWKVGSPSGTVLRQLTPSPSYKISKSMIWWKHGVCS